MSFIGKVETVKARVCTESDPEELLECSYYQWLSGIHPAFCIWKRMNGNCGHPTSKKELNE